MNSNPDILMHGIQRTNYQTTLCPQRRKIGFRNRCRSTPVYLACLLHVLDSPHISQWKVKTWSSNSTPQEHSATRGHIAYTPCHFCFAKACLPLKEEDERRLFSEKLREECFGLDRKFKTKKPCLCRRRDHTRHRHCSLGTCDFGHWVFSFTGKCLSHNW